MSAGCRCRNGSPVLVLGRRHSALRHGYRSQRYSPPAALHRHALRGAHVFLVELLLQFTDELEEIGEIAVTVMAGALLTPASFGLQNIVRLALLFS